MGSPPFIASLTSALATLRGRAILTCVTFASTGLLLGGACTSPTSGMMGSDSGTLPDVNNSPICKPVKPVSITPWAPPTTMHQKVCTDMQEITYLRAYKKNQGHVSPETQAFRNDPANAECLKCIETPVGASKYGPVIVRSNGTAEANYGGCVAIADGNTSSSGCGAILDAYNSCAIQECGDCADYTIPPYTDAKMCLSAAVAPGGECASANTTPACQAELSGVASSCGTLDAFLASWCAGLKVDDAGSMDTGGGGSGDSGAD